MGIIIIFCIALITSIILWRKTHFDRPFIYDFSAIVSTLSSVCLGIAIFSLSIDFNTKTKSVIAYYNVVKQYTQYNRDSLCCLEKDRILKEVISTNEYIIIHRISYNNFWYGIWYSKEIGNLELLK